MSDMPEFFIFSLSKAINIDINGSKQDIYDIKIMAPSNKNCEDQCITIQKEMHKAIREVQEFTGVKDINPDEATPEIQDNKQMGQMLIQAILSSEKADAAKIRRNFKTLATHGSFFLGDTAVVLTGYHYDLLSYNDTNKMLGEYLATFLLGMI